LRMEDTREAREKVRALMETRPSARPPDFVNPLEKIEQLLTCPICLDRYKVPKLLPCQHTFCLPCLESCAESAGRLLKCPECRAEHNIPYEGVKAFQTNYTLTGFLDIHLQATNESSAQIEEYIHRYNLERCKICDEKSECDMCAHCDRRACKECRNSHMEMLKRDLGRLLNQVKRLSNRIIEASDGVAKGMELTTLNCETTKTEVKEYFHRYQRELKKREEHLLFEIDQFQNNESRVMSNLRDVLELESSNMSEAVSRLEAALKGECTIDDVDLVKYKNTFTEGLEYLRNFQPDAEELFCKKLRFAPGDDAAKLPQAISTFGDLTVLVPQFAGRYLPLENSYLPRPFRVGLESDLYRGSRVKEDDAPMPSTRTTLRYGQRAITEEETSLRYRRRQALEDEAWNRLNNGGSPAHSRSPWTRSPVPEVHVAPPPPSVAAVERPPAPRIAPIMAASVPPPSAAKPPAPPPSAIPRPPLANTVVAAKPPLPRQRSSTDDTSLNEKIERIRSAHEKARSSGLPPPPSSATESASSAADSSEEAEASDEPAIASASTATAPRSRIRIICRASSVTRADESSLLSVNTGASSEDEPPPSPIPIQHYPDSSTVVRAGVAPTQVYNEEGELVPAPASMADGTRRRRPSLAREAAEYRKIPTRVFGKKGAKEGELNWPRGLAALPGGLIAVADSSNHRVCVLNAADGRVARVVGAYGTGNGQLDSCAGVAAGRGRQIVVTDRYNHRVVVFDSEGEVVHTWGGHGPSNGRFNNPWGVAVDEGGTIYVVDKDNHRVQMFDKQGNYLGKFGTLGHADGQLNTPLFVAISRLNQEVLVTDSCNNRVCVFDTHGVYKYSFGEEGFQAGQFKLPRGIAVDQKGNVIVADSGNNRVQVFSSSGEFIATFGSWGSGAGQLKGVEAVTVLNDGSIVVSDRDNHRVQVFS
ncbi:nhl-1, partial [Pristionchus pacificus]